MIDRFILILRQGAFGTVLVTMLIWGCYRTTGSEESDPDDMPPDFEVAEQVPVSVVLTAGENKYNCRYDDEEDNAYATVVDGEIRLLFTGCFVCETLNRKAHVDREEGGYSVLFTSPSVSGACGTTVLDLRLYLGPGEAGDRVAVYMPSTQEESGVTLVAETRADAEPVDCHSLPPCDMETPCEPSEERDDRPICAHLSTCGGSYCIWQEEACLMACGDTDCALSESHPLTPIC